MSKFLTLFIFLFSLNSYADYIKIEGSQVVSAGKYQQYIVNLYKDNGSVEDVTRLSRFESTNTYFRRAGEILFSPGLRGMPYQTYVKVDFKTPTQVYSDLINVNVDSTPLFIGIFGPQLVYFGSTVQYFANAQYQDMRFDITGQCEWHSFYGLIYANGVYRAPVYGNQVIDSLGCRFGNYNQVLNINIVR